MRHTPSSTSLFTPLSRARMYALLGALLSGSLPVVHAQVTPASPVAWQSCQALDDDPGTQLACFKRWAASQSSDAAPLAGGTAPSAPVSTPATALADARPSGCRDSGYSTLSRFWELQRGSDCGTLSLRGYRPVSLAITTSDSVNTQPSSPVPGYTAATAQPYKRTENRLQLSLRTKLASGWFKDGASEDSDRDSLWFGYTQRSYWQMYTSEVSGAFRNTDYEPELVYIYPQRIALAGGWTYRLSGVGLVHQSNGQDQPLHRDWDRVYVTGAAEKPLDGGGSLTVQGRLWQRVRVFSRFDANPGIENFVGRAELAGNWNLNRHNTLGVTLRHSLRSTANGSARLEWMFAPESLARTGLRYHVQLFSGYGDSLPDYNRRRNVLSVGVSLVDW
ncbi:MAG: phospholipase [Polaromonas sp.]|nr:phospholipase [Polaromonas sp.]